MATLIALAPMIAGVLGLGGTAYMWWNNRKNAANTTVMKDNAISQRDQATLQKVDSDIDSPDPTAFEKDISR